MATMKHCGEVVRIEGQSVFVRMTVNSACSGCHAKAVCGVSESTEKIVEVVTASASDFQIGESVEVALLENSMGTKSVVLAYVVPFFVLTIMLIAKNNNNITPPPVANNIIMVLCSILSRRS